MSQHVFWLIIRLILTITFVVISLLYIMPEVEAPVSDMHSSQLEKRVTVEENTEIIEFLDDDGQIAIAADLGYAIQIITYGDHIVTEHYYDNKGEPVSRYPGYYGIMRTNDDRGFNISLTYLDADGNPVMLRTGYATEKREYNESGQIIAARYYDLEVNPVQTRSEGYGKINDFDEAGRVSRITYIDTNGCPIMTGQGYASVRRDFYPVGGPQKGRVESEYYYDKKGDPVNLSLGQFGVHKEYDDYGREIVLTYLDANGNPMVTNKGYTTIRRTFLSDNTIATERYFDLDGKPYAIQEDRYGYMRDGGQTFWLDENGKVKFNLRIFLYNNAWVVVIIALALAAVSSQLSRKWNAALLVLYLGAIVYMTLLFRDNDISNDLRGLFSSYRMVFFDSGVRADILKNIWLFFPFGAILYKIYPKKGILLIPIVISITVEAAQYCTGRGFFEIDDIISNSLGGIFGFEEERLLCNYVIFIRNKHHRKLL